ncbi:exodeoxyribonuclease VII large subunit [Mobilisporobacter senegalensis]|uniref:Exodeoxyribonuclease 7 large subunit n=1 Tax=Mobilisporobacter senegalensis TaxID=1329262 RepID=A0A3N1XQS4_9FIRM|nr:exodeoxyribonuclease VII large subunit [Mobilisporobacter senegalensis]ROR27127.1 exodeoxyribonuclease VII large subunit [Mobilisporobacter senegalensis]
MDKVYSVTQINLYIKDMFIRDYALNNIYIKGEVSNCKYHTSGHIYFTLKDEKGQMAAVMFAGQRSGLKFRLEEGQSVIVLGSISVYERDGKYQLYAREILLDGSGVLYQKFEELKRNLEGEGLFSKEYKKTIPMYPKKIGIVTARTGAAIQDIINIISRRNPYIQLILYPALVQGEGAAKSIMKGIGILDKMELDTIIVGRGGGSIEDLWAFNEEIVARAIFDCHTPIISAVGHETDTTISDFVSDLRAPTPSAAAELATNNINDLYTKIYDYNVTLNHILKRKISLYRSLLEQKKLKLEHSSPIYQIRQKRQHLMDYEEKLGNLISDIIKEKRHSLAIYIEKLNGLSPIAKLNKGYALISDGENNIVNSIDKIKVEDTIKVSMLDGDILAKVEELNGRRRV